MDLRTQLFQNPFLEYQNNIFYQKDLQRNNPFEELYLKLRGKENRVHSDEIVKRLPEFIDDHPNKKEWEMRRSTLRKLKNHLKKSGAVNILELGCGNGWLSSNLAASLNVEICAVDINETELLQGARIFKGQSNLHFIFADIFSTTLEKQKFSNIILGGSVQYFDDLKRLVFRLFNLLDESGSIYIVDSPVYSSFEESVAAQDRSRNYFKSIGFPEMAQHYFHHTFNQLNEFNYKIHYNPKSLLSLIGRQIVGKEWSVFPVIQILK